MFIGRWDNLQRYPYLKENLKHIIQRALHTIDDRKDCGDIVLEPNSLWVELIEVNTQQADLRPFEIHKEFIDVHVLLQGREYMGVSHGELTIEDQSRAGSDVYFGSSSQGQYMMMNPGEMAIFFPHEVHKPLCHTEGDPVSVRKAVIKIRQSLLDPSNHSVSI